MQRHLSKNKLTSGKSFTDKSKAVRGLVLVLVLLLHPTSSHVPSVFIFTQSLRGQDYVDDGDSDNYGDDDDGEVKTMLANKRFSSCFFTQL